MGSKRVGGTVSAAIAGVALAVGVVSPAAGASGASAGSRTIHFVGIVTEVDFVDLGTTGTSLGDQIVFSEKLLRNGEQIGHEGAVCTTVSVKRQEAQCVATFWFPSGQITAQGLVNLGNPAPYTAPVTGGSGTYEGAEGVLHVRPVTDVKGIQAIVLVDG